MNKFVKMEQEENVLSQELISNILDAPDSNDGSLQRLFPEFDFSGLYGLHRAREPLTKYLVMYDVVIVNLYLFESKAEFQKLYGVSIEEMKILHDMGKIHIVVCFPFEKFPAELSFLLDRPMPRSSRSRQYLAQKRALTIDLRLEQVKNIEWIGENSDYPRSKFKDVNLFWGTYSSDLFDLELVGLGDVADDLMLVSKADPVLAHELTVDYCSFLARPIFDCIGGVNTYSKNDSRQANRISLSTGELDLVTKKHFGTSVVHEIEGFLGVHPSDLIEFFPDTLFVSQFENVNNIRSFVEQIEIDPDVKEFRKLLLQLARTKSPVSDLTPLGNELTRKLEKDAAKYGAVFSAFRDVMYLGVNAPPYVAGIVGGPKMISLAVLFGPIYSSVIGSRTKQMDKWAQRVFESLNNTLIDRPMLSAFHKAKDL